MSRIKTSQDPRANGKALESSIHKTHERAVTRLESALNKLQEGSRQWIDVVNELAAEDRRYRRELEEYRDRILIATTPNYRFVARVQEGRVVCSPEDEAARRRFDEEFGTDTGDDDDKGQGGNGAPAAAMAPPLDPGPQRPRKPRSGVARSTVQ